MLFSRNLSSDDTTSSYKGISDCSLTYLSFLLLPLQLLQNGLKLLLLLLRLLYGDLALLLIGHSHYSQDQVDEVEGTEENHQHKEEHVVFPRSPQRLEGKTKQVSIFILPIVITSVNHLATVL